MRGSELRQKFLQFFEDRGHVIVPSDSLVPSKDPTLLFTSAGMVQFKDQFLGQGPMPYRRAVTCQKCLRTSDIDKIGKTSRHHTFFEMLGNFSFGDYFKKETIHWAWEFVREVLQLPKEQLFITIYTDDDEAMELWVKEGIEKERIVRMGMEDNFWTMGPTGPCGPCSEIIYDRGPDKGCQRPECDITCSCDRYVELWNLVFTQFDRAEDGTLKPLPQKNIDTGMGLERAAAVLQGVDSNFDCDLIKPIMNFVVELTGVSLQKALSSHRLIADHLRALAFLIADGVLPSNEGRGYVERRLLRRAVCHGIEMGMKEPFLYKAVGIVMDIMKDAYPDLTSKREHISKVILSEEEKFQQTLMSGLNLLEEMIEHQKAKGQSVLTGPQLFKLYDTFGFPLELAEEIAEDKGLRLDKEGYEACMEAQRDKAREAWPGVSKMTAPSKLYYDLASELGSTPFLGYKRDALRAKVLAIIIDDFKAYEAHEGQRAEVVLERTPFYPETGGQVGDTGTFKAKGVEALVLDTQQPLLGLIIHKVEVKKGRLLLGQSLRAEVDMERRRRIALHHSATHLLQSALKEVLGGHVYQSGSMVEPDRLRFDFAHFQAPEKRQLLRVEELVNEHIRANYPVKCTEKNLDEAKREGATALFGEKYGQRVRVVKMGTKSMELCGGTHTMATGDIGLFRIISESSIAAGFRRIEAVCGPEAFKLQQKERQTLEEVMGLLNVPLNQIPERVRTFMDMRKNLEKELANLKDTLARMKAEELLSKVQMVNGVKVLTASLPSHDASALRAACDALREKIGSGVILLGSPSKEKVALVAAVTPDLCSKIHAGQLINEIAKIVEGGGGGRADMAQAGGKNPSKLAEALAMVTEVVARMKD